MDIDNIIGSVFNFKLLLSLSYAQVENSEERKSYLYVDHLCLPQVCHRFVHPFQLAVPELLDLFPAALVVISARAQRLSVTRQWRRESVARSCLRQ